MELPHGVLLRSFKGPVPLSDLNAALLKDSFTGFMRASNFEGKFVESVIIYGAGKPAVSFISDGKSDRHDNDLKVAAAVVASEDTVVELFSLNEGQLRLAMDFSKEFIIRQAPPPPPPPPPPKPAAEPPRPMPVQRPRPQGKPLSMPEVRGTFASTEHIESLRSYVESRKDETGHVMLVRPDGSGEYHLLFLHGKAVAAYSPGESGTAFMGKVMDTGGDIEFYRVEETIIQSILKMYPHIAVNYESTSQAQPVVQAPASPATPKPVPPVAAPPAAEPPRAEHPKSEDPRPMQVLRPDSKPYIPLPVTPKAEAPPREAIPREAIPREASSASRGTAMKLVNKVEAQEPPGPMETQHRFDISARQGVGVPAKSLFDKSERFAADGSMGTPAPESRSTGSLKGDMDDDADFVKKVEKEFVGNVDDLLKRLELSHLKVPDKKKR